MADVQWIKIKVGMFDGESFKKIKRAKIGGEKFRDKLTAVWFELMDFAGKCNHGGAFINSREIPFTDLEDIATMIDRETEELELCMAFFINEGMVDIVDDVYRLSNWSEYQNAEALEKLREQKRVRQAKWRANKALKSGVDENSSTEASTDAPTEHLPSYSYSISNSKSIKDKGEYEGKENPEKSEETPVSPPSVPYEAIKNLYNEICKSYSRCTVMSDARKKAVKARFSSGYTLEDFKTLFTKAEDSNFLKGGNDRNWSASFDWLIKDANMAKVLDGNYDNHASRPNQNQGIPRGGNGFQTSNPFLEMLNEERGNQ